MSDSLQPHRLQHACQASLSLTVSWSLLKLLHQVSDALQTAHPLLHPYPALSRSQHQGLALTKPHLASVRWDYYTAYLILLMKVK